MVVFAPAIFTVLYPCVLYNIYTQINKMVEFMKSIPEHYFYVEEYAHDEKSNASTSRDRKINELNAGYL